MDVLKSWILNKNDSIKIELRTYPIWRHTGERQIQKVGKWRLPLQIIEHIWKRQSCFPCLTLQNVTQTPNTKFPHSRAQRATPNGTRSLPPTPSVDDALSSNMPLLLLDVAIFVRIFAIRSPYIHIFNSFLFVRTLQLQIIRNWHQSRIYIYIMYENERKGVC